MIKEGVLENPVPVPYWVSMFLRLLLLMDQQNWKFTKRKFIASMDDIFITVRGKGAAMVHNHIRMWIGNNFSSHPSQPLTGLLAVWLILIFHLSVFIFWKSNSG